MVAAAMLLEPGHIFKEELQRLGGSAGLGIATGVAHYPPYCSKYNPIEHRSVSACDSEPARASSSSLWNW